MKKFNEDISDKAYGKCTCRQECPVNGQCKKVDTIYEAVVKDSSGSHFKYIGKTSTIFILRYRNHIKDMNLRTYEKNCELAKKIWELKDNGETYEIKWGIRKESRSYRPGNSFCMLCIEEINEIISYREKAVLLNTRNELYKKCRHKAKFKVING